MKDQGIVRHKSEDTGGRAQITAATTAGFARSEAIRSASSSYPQGRRYRSLQISDPFVAEGFHIEIKNYLGLSEGLLEDEARPSIIKLILF
ncbi:hypothetical protein HGRIS_014062 [Hohenbuehelia grisea]|uniref:Uncharacterized protein n=1 Tax=Hohenbuehelia grisea TaxID=104357 RepID=A0ABR3JT70_9AGAR